MAPRCSARWRWRRPRRRHSRRPFSRPKIHYPILKAQLETGRIIGMKSYVPTYHGDGRADWTFAVELTFASADAFYDNSGAAAIIARLYPDQETFQREEQRRFEILDAHWDMPLNVVDFR